MTDKWPCVRKFRWNFRLFYFLFHPMDSQPFTKFEGAAGKGSGVVVAQLFVERKGRGILRSDDGVVDDEALISQDLFQGGVQGPADAPALCFGAKIDGRLAGPVVGRPGEGGGAVGIAQDVTAFFPDDPGEPGGDGAEAFQEGLLRGDVVFKCAGGVQNIGSIDRQDLGYIPLRGNADQRGFLSGSGSGACRGRVSRP